MELFGMKVRVVEDMAADTAVIVHNERQAMAEAYGAGDISVGRITGQYPNAWGFTTITHIGD